MGNPERPRFALAFVPASASGILRGGAIRLALCFLSKPLVLAVHLRLLSQCALADGFLALPALHFQLRALKQFLLPTLLLALNPFVMAIPVVLGAGVSRIRLAVPLCLLS